MFVANERQVINVFINKINIQINTHTHACVHTQTHTHIHMCLYHTKLNYALVKRKEVAPFLTKLSV